MKYSIVIPTYNHCDDLLKPCIDSIFKFTNMGDVELIIVANGCKDNTKEYLSSLKDRFSSIGFDENLKICWYDQPLGYSKATNAGIKVATTDYIVLLNNDTILLSQEKDTWLRLFESEFVRNPKCGIACVIKGLSEPAGKDFAIFFCVMVHRKVFNKIGLLNEEYGVGGGEDTEFSIEAEKAGFQVCQVLEKTWEPTSGLYTGVYPIYHKGEGTVHDVTLVPDWNDIFLQNSLKLAKKYNYEWYRWRLSDYCERGVFLQGDPVFPRETTRYKWAAENMVGTRLFELGCSSGYGVQFLPENVMYTGLDYGKFIIQAAKEQNWKRNTSFIHADVNTHELDQYDTIVAFEVIEHLDNGLEIVEKLKKYCKRLMISVPYMEDSNSENYHHKLHMLTEINFPDFKFKYINEAGDLLDEPENRGDLENINLMLCIWDNPDNNLRVEATKPAVDNNYENYLYSLSNNYERAVFLKNDVVFPREATRYLWAANHIVGTSVFELGCSTGYGIQFLPKQIEYTGLDYDNTIIQVASEQNWLPAAKFINADINTFDLGFYDTIIAFEVIEHLDNGLEIVEKLKKHCKRLLISVPYKETPGFWGEHHKLHMLDESHLPGFEYKYIDRDGNINDTPLDPLMNLMLCKYDA